MRWTWIWRGALVAAVALAAVPAVEWWRTPTVRVASAERGPVAEVVYATGVVEPVDWAKVVPVVRGRVIDLCDCEGRQVVRGQVLGRLDDAEPAAQLAELIARQELIGRTYERVQQLQSRGVATAEQLDRAQAEVLQVRALISAQRERMSNYVLRAPIDGTVLRRDFHVGEIVGTSDVLYWVGQPRPLRIVAEVAEEDIALVAPGQPVLVRHDGFRGRRIGATVGDITPKGDPVQRSFGSRWRCPTIRRCASACRSRATSSSPSAPTPWWCRPKPCATARSTWSKAIGRRGAR